ncbi:MAG: 3-oxoacyl-[acyl-carrier-protein] synthase [Gammaproteobacteria bacterium]|jgi:3-oxoacyl-[acyl-carrier-protein] synthase-1|nr:3-oxoacyl-[acyl-carrier-protein] synthase [Gammaproteobacteria bacterium]
MLSEPAYVVALGASTPIGRTAWSSAAAVRAGISGFTHYPHLMDSAGEPVKIALAPWLDLSVTGVERFWALLRPALEQVLELRMQRNPDLRMALALALPSHRPGLEPSLPSDLVGLVKSDCADVFAATAVFPNGHAAGIVALEAVCKKLAQGVFDACVIAGVDSYAQPATLEWLEDCDQLHGAGPLNNAWGFIPGEGAGALLVVSRSVAEQFRDVLYAQVLGVSTATESKCIKTETVCIGEGLTHAFRGALQSLPAGETVSDVYCDMNGEPYRADEYGFTCLRTAESFQSASDFVAPADCWGDVSAASAPLSIALAAIAARKGYAKGSTAFVWASSELGERGAATLRVAHGASDAR